LPVFRLTILAYRQIQPFRSTQMNTSERFYKPNGCSSWLRSVLILLVRFLAQRGTIHEITRIAGTRSFRLV
jgi:hypothetical protein